MMRCAAGGCASIPGNEWVNACGCGGVGTQARGVWAAAAGPPWPAVGVRSALAPRRCLQLSASVQPHCHWRGPSTATWSPPPMRGRPLVFRQPQREVAPARARMHSSLWSLRISTATPSRGLL
jgi:hypothetical protein